MCFETDIERAAEITREEPLILCITRSIRREDVPMLLTQNRLYGDYAKPHLGREKLRELHTFREDSALPKELRITAIQTTTAMGMPMAGINTIAWLCGQHGSDIYTVVGQATFMFKNVHEVYLRFLAREDRATLGRLHLAHLA